MGGPENGTTFSTLDNQPSSPRRTCRINSVRSNSVRSNAVGSIQSDEFSRINSVGLIQLKLIQFGSSRFGSEHSDHFRNEFRPASQSASQSASQARCPARPAKQASQPELLARLTTFVVPPKNYVCVIFVHGGEICGRMLRPTLSPRLPTFNAF